MIEQLYTMIGIDQATASQFQQDFMVVFTAVFSILFVVCIVNLWRCLVKCFL